MSNWFTRGLNWAANRTPGVSNIKGAIEGNTQQAILGPGAYIKGDVTKAGQTLGLAPTPSEQEKQNLEEMRQFKSEMLAALRDRMANPIAAPQLGAPSWMGYQTPTGPGTHTAGQPSVPMAPVALAGGAPSPMAAEIERIKKQRMLALLTGNGAGLKLG